MRLLIIAALLLCVPVATVGAVAKTAQSQSKAEHDRALAWCRKKYGTSLESVEYTKRFGQTGYFCLTRN
jgi:hypothetical protein